MSYSSTLEQSGEGGNVVDDASSSSSYSGCQQPLQLPHIVTTLADSGEQQDVGFVPKPQPQPAVEPDATLLVSAGWDPDGKMRKLTLPLSSRALRTKRGFARHVKVLFDIGFPIDIAVYDPAYGEYIIVEPPRPGGLPSELISALMAVDDGHQPVYKIKLYRLSLDEPFAFGRALGGVDVSHGGSASAISGSVSAVTNRFLPDAAGHSDNNNNNSNNPSQPGGGGKAIHGQSLAAFPFLSQVCGHSVRAATVDGSVDVGTLKMLAQSVRSEPTETTGSVESPSPGPGGLPLFGIGAGVESSGSDDENEGDGRFGGRGGKGGGGRRFPHRRLYPFEAHAEETAGPHPFVDGNSKITVIDYSHDKKRMSEVTAVEDLKASPKPEWANVRWINVEGIDISIITQLAALYKLHPLAVEDAATTPHQPKLTRFPGQFFVLLYSMHLYDKNGTSPDDIPAVAMAATKEEGSTVELRSEQLSIFVLRDVVITIGENKYPDSMFDALWRPVLDRMSYKASKLRSSDSTYLLYAVLDAVVDQIFPVTSYWGNLVENLEEEMVREPSRVLLENSRQLQKELKRLRTLLWQTTDLCVSLHQDANMPASTRVYLSDVLDHLRLCESVCSTYVDAAGSVSGMFADFQNERLNSTLMLLTIVSNLLLPISTCSGIYGMNFEWFPELGWKWSYVVFWCVAVVQAVFQLYMFRRSGWI